MLALINLSIQVAQTFGRFEFNKIKTFIIYRDKMEYYNDFLEYLSESMIKVQELMEKVTIKHSNYILFVFFKLFSCHILFNT